MQYVNIEVDFIGATVTAHATLPRILARMHARVYGVERVLVECDVTVDALVARCGDVDCRVHVFMLFLDTD